MKFYSRRKDVVFCFEQGECCKSIESKVAVRTEIIPVKKLKGRISKKVNQLQGKWAATYLKLRYGSPETFVLLAWIGDQLVHIEWIVPARVMKSRYPFLPKKSWAIISCFTTPEFRGNHIYPSQLQKVVNSNIKGTFFIWVSEKNSASIKGIRRAGAKQAGRLLQIKYVIGLFSKIRYESDV